MLNDFVAVKWISIALTVHFCSKHQYKTARILSLSEDTFREIFVQTYARYVKVHINVQLFVDEHQMFKRACVCLCFVYIEALEFMLFNVNLLITNLW